jgi:hypothetical protein
MQLLLCVMMVVYYFIGQHVVAMFGVPIASATTTTFSSTSTARSNEQNIYVSLVSIPVMERVLPLKNLAEELLHRGYRVSFALPEVYDQHEKIHRNDTFKRNN